MYEALETLLSRIVGIFEQICLGILKTTRKAIFAEIFASKVCVLIYVYTLVLGRDTISTEGVDPK